jgi:hypothetical protein
VLSEMSFASGADQRTTDWRLDRAGKITASRFIDAIAMSEGGYYASGPKKGQPKPIVPLAKRTSYMRELAFERTAQMARHEVNGKSLEWGRDVEGHAQEAYQLQSGNTVRPSPFVLHPKYTFIGCSPDGLVDDDCDGRGGTESKCPFSEEVHIRTWLEGVPQDHIPQVQGCMFVTERDWWDFISYDPRQAPELRLYVQRVYRDDAYIAHLERSLLQFEVELQGMVKRLLSRAAGLPA